MAQYKATPAEIIIQNKCLKNDIAQGYLASTDWYIIRATETGIVVPQDILDKRALARADVVIV
jgi:hypothetical protein